MVIQPDVCVCVLFSHLCSKEQCAVFERVCSDSSENSVDFLPYPGPESSGGVWGLKPLGFEGPVGL